MLRGNRLFAALAIVLCLVGTGCSVARLSSATGRTDSTGPVSIAAADPHGTLAKLIAQWNAAHPDQPVSLDTLPADPLRQHSMLLENLAKPSSSYDLALFPTSNTAELAAQGWLQPLQGHYAIDRAALQQPAITAATYHGALFAAPLDIDAGLLYYRSDLVPTAPVTWTQLTAGCATARRLSIGCYAGQFAKGDDLAANAMEAVSSAGGRLVGPDGQAADLTSAAVKNGLQFLADSYRTGVIPKAAITYQASQSAAAFSSGALLYMRNWASQYPAVAASAMKARFKLAPLPGKDGPGSAVLGGDSLGLNVAAQHKKTALAFIDFLLSTPAQTARLAGDGAPPATIASYQDPALVAKYPVLSELAASLSRVQPTPVSEYYPSLASAIADSSYAAVAGTEPVTTALSQLATSIAAASR